MAIGEAVEALEAGLKVGRAGWNGKGMYLRLVPGETFNLPDNAMPVAPSICLRTATGTMQPGWNASTPDLLARDWEIIA